MSTVTTIEWADKTWSPLIGCTRVSPGCDNCYAITQAHIHAKNPHPKVAAANAGLTERRDGRIDWTGQINLLDNRLAEPLSWRKPARVFVNSMSDLFAAEVPDEFVAKVFAVMGLAGQHTFQLLSKRHARMRSLLNSPAFRIKVLDAAHLMVSGEVGGITVPRPACEAYWARRDAALRGEVDSALPWPLPNLWLGVSVENQQWANTRIPALLQTPAAVRWISAEPLLGPIDLSAWITPQAPMARSEAPRTWVEWTWPDWVPEEARTQIEKFWKEDWGRGPHAWMADAIAQGAPGFGQRWTTPSAMRMGTATGRYIHAWNNIGRLALDDGTMGYTSFSQRSVREQQPLNWVVAGGESGPDARPMHPSWPRDLRDQCAAARVPFLFKQWGSWAPYASQFAADREEQGRWDVFVNLDGTTGQYCISEDHDRVTNWAGDFRAGESSAVSRVSKKSAGRLLDGRTWDEYPQPRALAASS